MERRAVAIFPVFDRRLATRRSGRGGAGRPRHPSPTAASRLLSPHHASPLQTGTRSVFSRTSLPLALTALTLLALVSVTVLALHAPPAPRRLPRPRVPATCPPPCRLPRPARRGASVASIRLLRAAARRRRDRRDRRDRRHDPLTLAAPLSQERLVRSYPVSWVLAWAYASCTLLSCAAAAADGSLGAVGAALASPRDAAIVAYSATCGCVAYFVLIAYASKHLPAELVSVTVAVEPLAVSALGMLLLGAEPCAAEGAGFALAFGGTALLSRAVQSESEGGERGGQAGPPGGASDQEASFRDPLIRA